MAKNYNYRLIYARESYTPSEIARLFNLDKKTIFRWVKEGLRPIQFHTNPLLIMGSDLKDFIMKRRKARRNSLNNEEFYCFKCKKAVKSKEDKICIVQSDKTIGKNKAKQLIKTGICEYCNGKINKYLKLYQKD